MLKLTSEIDYNDRLGDISAKLPELNLANLPRISNGTNSPRLALLYRQNFWSVHFPLPSKGMQNLIYQDV